MGWGDKLPEAILTVDQGIADTTAYVLFKNGKYEQVGEAEFKQASFLNVQVNEIFDKETAKVYANAHLHGTGFIQDGKHVPLDKIYNNVPPTHDPYTNPNAHIYYECACGAILDPHTKSFAALNNHASEKGWKIRFGERGYTPYCVKCGEGVE